MPENTPAIKDRDIREPLFDYLEEQFGKVRILEEKRMGKSRADVVLVTEQALVGIEIKSDADTYARLARQVKDYEKYYDQNYVVVGTRHAMHIEEHVPETWGIITAELEAHDDTAAAVEPAKAEPVTAGPAEPESAPLDFYLLRAAKPNPHVDWKKKIEILWRPELARIQALNDMPKYARMSKQSVAAKILETVPEDTLQAQLLEELFERDYTTIGAELDAYRREHRSDKPRRRRRRRR